jgi:hypothetical protein
LVGRLADTTDGAAKRREAVLAELTAETSLLADLEEKHLLPLLAKHEETKAVVAAARKDNAAILHQLGELSRVPKVGDAFRQSVDRLHKAFQQSVRDDRKELAAGSEDRSEPRGGRRRRRHDAIRRGRRGAGAPRRTRPGDG